MFRSHSHLPDLGVVPAPAAEAARYRVRLRRCITWPRPGETRELKKPNRLLEQDDEVLRRVDIHLRRASRWVPLEGRGISLSQGVCATILWIS